MHKFKAYFNSGAFLQTHVRRSHKERNGNENKRLYLSFYSLSQHSALTFPNPSHVEPVVDGQPAAHQPDLKLPAVEFL